MKLPNYHAGGDAGTMLFFYIRRFWPGTPHHGHSTRNMKLLIFLAWVIAVFPAFADAGDDTLRFYLSKSEVVVAGKIVEKPLGVIDEAGIVNYTCSFQVRDVLTGADSGLKDKLVKVNIVRFERGPEDKHPLIAKDSGCVLFLRRRSPDSSLWETADFWFGVQHSSPWMERSLKPPLNGGPAMRARNSGASGEPPSVS